MKRFQNVFIFAERNVFKIYEKTVSLERKQREKNNYSQRKNEEEKTSRIRKKGENEKTKEECERRRKETEIKKHDL